METLKEQLEGFLPSPQQTRVWKLREGTPGAAFRTQFTVQVSGPLDRELLRAALQDVVRRHEILRTTFRTVPGVDGPLQVVEQDATCMLTERDLGDLPAAEAMGRLDELFLSGKEEPSELESGPPLRVSLFSLREDEQVLLISLPALCADAGTAGILAEEICRAYAALMGDSEPEPEPLQYVEFSELQNELLGDEAGEGGKEFWDGQGIEQIQPPTLPFEKNVVGARPFRPESLTFGIEPGAWLKAEEISARHGAPPPAFLLACWQVLLWRLSGRPEVVVGVTTDGRKYEQLDGMPGLCARCLPLSSKLQDGYGFLRLLEDVHEATAKAYEWQEGFILGADASAGPDAFFPFCFEFNELPAPVSAGRLSFKVDRLWSCIDRWNLRLSCARSDDDLRLSLDFDPEAFDPADVGRLARYLRTLVESASRTPQATVDALEFHDGEELHRLLVAFNDTEFAHPWLGRPVQLLFEEQAGRTPEGVAVEAGERQVTYREINGRANQLSRRLKALGVGPDVPVGIFMEHSAEMVIAILGVLKAGGAYVPLDPAYPQERLAFMLEDAGAHLLLTQERLTAVVPQDGPRLVTLDSDWEPVAAEDLENPAVEVAPENLAYIIYTSGSTGRPKGTMITHGGLSNYLAWAGGAYEVEKGRGAPLHSSVAFDLSVTSLFLPLLMGRSVVLARALTSLDALACVLRRERNFSLLKVTPAHARLLGQQLSEEELPGRARMLILGGEALTSQDVAAWRRHAPETVIVNEYGPTETVVGCCVYKAPPGGDAAEVIPIGRPVANTQLYVLDRHLCPVPAGVPGELYIGGAGLARGYLRRPDVTAERFIPNPFGDRPGARLYRTGDVVRHLSDGNLEYLGRNDQQLKVRGFRVELGEIEAVLGQHPAVREVVVVAKADSGGNQRLVAYFVTRPGHDESLTAVLRAHLEQKLPDYMLPTAYVLLESLPLTPNGKVDRDALPEPDYAAARTGTPYVAPRTQEEEVLAGIWSQVLGVERVGIDDGFFSLGGDSIRSLQVVARAGDRDLSFTVDTLFEHQTIRRLAEALRQSEAREAPPRIEPFGLVTEQDRQKMPGDVEDAYPLSKLQAGMVFHRELMPGSAIYHDVFGYRMKAPLNLELLRAAVEGLMERHPILRTSFDLSRFSEPLQLVHLTAPVPLTVEDLRHLSPDEQEAALRAFMEAEKGRDFDYGQPPLLRFHVHVRSAETFQFWISFHHAILDGWSDISLLVELFLSYHHLLRSEVVPFSPPATRYRDFVSLEREALSSDEQREFWLEHLRDCDPVRLPRWQAPTSGEAGTHDGVLHEVPFSQEVSDGLHELARLSAVPVKTVLLAAHMRVMGLLGGRAGALTTMVTVGRPETLDGDRVFGLHLNSPPFRLKPSGGTWLELIKETFEAERRMLPFRRFPVAEIQRLKGGQRLAETLFYFTHYYNVLDLQQFPDFQVVDWYEFEESSFTLSSHFYIHPHTSRVGLNLTYDPGQIGPAQVRAMAGYFAKTLAAMAGNPSGRYDTFSPLSDEETRRMLVEWNDTRIEYPAGESCLHQLFEAQAAATPEAVALVFGGDEWTYRELDGRANQLASYLRARGVGPETIVGLCLERSPELIVGLLGVLKAGGAYLPVDPSYPAERRDFILKDARVPLLLTRRALTEEAGPGGHAIAYLDAIPSGVGLPDDECPPTLTYPENTAYVIYTSGSTGRPKGVSVTHRGVVNHARAVAERYGLRPGDRVLQFAAVGFDVLAEELFPTLASGAAVVLWPEGAPASPAEFLRFVEDQRLTILNLPTPLWHDWVTEMQSSGGRLPESVRQLIVGSDTVLPGKLSAWRGMVGDGVGWTNSYGLTEATITTTIYEPPSHPTEFDATSVPIGRPIPNTEVYLLNQHLQPVPVGVPGEIYVGGAGLARGYLNHPALTAEKFVPHPFSDEPGARLFRTGDAARYSPDGVLEFLGRLDSQVKVRGFRIELGEIDAALAAHPLLSQAVAAVRREGSSGDNRVIAYVVPTDGQAPTVGELRHFLKERLPEYMLPAAFVTLESLPLTPHGKVDRRALPAPDGSRPELGVAFVAPRGAAEEVVAGVWAEVLGLGRVGVHDNFFELGGHSLLATQAVARLRDIFQVELPLRNLYEHPTVEGLVESLSELAGGREAAEEIAELVKELERMSPEEVRQRLGG